MNVYYAIPTSAIAEYVEGEDPVPVEVGLAVHDSTWNKVVNRRATKLVLPSTAAADVAVGAIAFDLPPNSYTVSMYVKPADTPLIGGWKGEYDFPDFSTGAFMMSDLLLSPRITPPAEGSPFNRGDVNVIPSFTGRFLPEQPVYVYYELYNLGLTNDRTNYETEIELRPSDPGRGGFLGLFGSGDRPVLTLQTQGGGSVVSPIEYAEIDMSDVDPGEYDLTVRVRDLVSGVTKERSHRLVLVEQE